MPKETAVPAAWRIRVYEDQRLVYTAECPGPVELGRQSEGEGRPYLGRAEAGYWRVVMARLDEQAVSRKHLWAEPLADGRIRLTNQSAKLPVRFPDGGELGPGGSCDLTLPVTLHLGHREVCLESAQEGSTNLHSLAEAPLPPGKERPGPSLYRTALDAGLPGEALVRWLQGALGVLHSAATSREFFDRAAGALVDLVELDAGVALLLEGGQWREQARKTGPGLAAAEVPPSRQVLTKLREEKRTFWQVPPAPGDSLREVTTLVAAPILDRRGEVIGALYGHRGRAAKAGLAARPVSRLEALLVELLAGAVAAGLARLEQEQAALQGQAKLLRVERELEIGREIQAGFLPEELPQLPGWEVRAYFRPAREVGGDFYDAFVLPGDHLALVIADVCDKGVGAALYMTLVRSLLRAFALQAHRRFGWSAGRRQASLLADLTALSTVEFTNNYVARTHARANMFATLFFGVLDAAGGSLTYVNAGHDPPVLAGAAEVKARLGPTGPVVGMSPDVPYDIGRVALEPGDTLLAYTDGVTEARDRAGAFFTEKRLLALLEESIPSAAALLERVVANLQGHVAGADPYDDVTMLAVRRY
jgi:sigma-B regulation protein RsbU (phosphoserine phosphatase)